MKINITIDEITEELLNEFKEKITNNSLDYLAINNNEIDFVDIYDEWKKIKINNFSFE